MGPAYAAGSPSVSLAEDRFGKRDTVVNNAGTLVVKAFEDTFANAVVRPQSVSMGKYWGNFCGDGDIWDKGVAPAEFVKKAFEGAVK